jgi:hypothetical protein
MQLSDFYGHRFPGETFLEYQQRRAACEAQRARQGRMLTRVLSVIIAATLILFAAAMFMGCTTAPTWSAATRKAAHAQVLVADEFLRWELTHRATVGSNVQATAELLRRQVPPAARELRAALDRYDAGQTNGIARYQAEDGLLLLTDLARLAANSLALAQSNSPASR